MHSISKLNKFIISSSAWFGGVFFYPGTAIIKAVLRLCEKNYKKMKKSVDKHKRLVYYIYCSRHTWAAKLKKICGEVSEWFKELVLKTSDSERGRGFESHPLRHIGNERVGTQLRLTRQNWLAVAAESIEYKIKSLVLAWRSTQEAEEDGLLNR